MPNARPEHSRQLLVALTMPLLAGCVVLLPQTNTPLLNANDLSLAPSIAPAGIEALTTPLPPAETGKVTVIPAKASSHEDSLWERLVDGYDLDDKSESAVKQALRQFNKHQRSTRHTLSKARPYLWEIVDAVEARGLPTELALLPAIESRFNPRARSHRRAQGLWQFMPGTAHHLGLQQNWWVDARLDATLSTHAALDYLQYLHGRFDDWALALAAYNAGEARVQRAINQADGNRDFWELELPAETRAYIPKLLALSLLIEDHDDLGFRLPELPNQQTTDTVLFDRQIDLALAAEYAGIDLHTLQTLNPSLLRWATPPDGPHSLRVPAGKARQLQSAMADIPASEWTQWQPYVVRDGDNLGLIAQRFGIQLADLKQINKLNSNLIRAGQTLVLPTSARLAIAENQTSLTASAPPHGSVRVEYMVKAGDTLWDIARLYKVSVATLSRWNGLGRESILRPGKTLIVWVVPTEKAAKATKESA